MCYSSPLTAVGYIGYTTPNTTQPQEASIMNISEYTYLMDNYIQTAYEEFKQDDTRDLEDIVHEIADGSQQVIYYGKAWDFVSFVRFADLYEYEAAQEMVNDIGENTSDLDTLMTQMAYWLIYNIVRGAVEERLESEEE